MKPESYATYHQIYDRFSSVKLFPILLTFCQKIQQHAPANTSWIADVGAGTGLFTSLLMQKFNDAQIALIEPSIYMMPYAKARLSTKRVHFYQSSFEQILELIPNQDVFVFQRSLYALSGNIDYYVNLSNQLSAKTSKDGIVGIFEIGQLYDIHKVYEHYQSSLEILGLSKKQFTTQWPILEQALKNFNHGVASGDYMLFNQNNLDQIFSNNFTRIDSDDSNIFVYRKNDR